MTQDDFDKQEQPKEPQTFADWLQSRYMEYYLRANGRTTQREFARWMGVSETLITAYLKGDHKPGIKIAERMADKLGPQVYDLLDMPRKMPRDKALVFIIEAWTNPKIMSERDKREIMQHVRELKEQAEKKRGSQLSEA